MDPIQLLELKGFSSIEAASFRGTIASCLVRSQESGATMTAQWLEQGATNPDFYGRVRRLWSRNERSQPLGSLRQSFYHDAGQYLIRVIQSPAGQPMSQWLMTRQFGVEDALKTAISLTEVLQSWHAAKLIQGSLSSDTVYRDANHRVELADASLLEMNDSERLLSLPSSELIFFPPETIGSLPREISPSSDLYSVGVILFGMIAGVAPIQAEDASDFLDRQLCSDPPRLRELKLRVPASLDSVVARLLRRDPRDRYATASALAYDLRQIKSMEAAGPSTKVFAIGTRDVRNGMTESSLIGREQELQAARWWISEVTRGVAGIYSLTGCQTSSRRDVMDEIAWMAAGQGLVVCRGAAATGASQPLQSLENVLASIDRLCRDDDEMSLQLANNLREHAATLSNLLPSMASHWSQAQASAGPEEYGSQRVAASLEELFVVLANQSRGVVLLFDELDRADELTQTIVGRLADRIDGEENPIRLGIIASGADKVVLRDAKSMTQLKLGAVSELSVRRSLLSSAGKISESIMDSIVEIAEGSTEKASAILGRMIDTNVVRPSPDGWLADGDIHDALRGDESFADLLDRQVKDLTPHAQRVLSIAAVVGKEFDLFMLSFVADMPYADVLAVSTDAVGRRLLWRNPKAGLYCFAHDQIHEQLCDFIEPPDQRRLHLKSAAYLEKQTPLNLFALAYHYDAADRGDLAFQTAMSAATQARSRYALAVARDQLQIAKRWVHPADRKTGLQILNGLAEIDLLLGQYDDAAVHLRRALRLAHLPAEKAALKQQMGELAFKRGQFTLAASEYEEALQLLGVRLPRSLAMMILGLVTQSVKQTAHTYFPTLLVGQEGPPSELDSLRYRLMSRLSHVYWFSRDKLWTLANHLRSLNLAERFEPSEILAAVYSEHGPVMSLLRWFKRANRYAERSLEIRQDRNDVWGQGQSLHYHSVVLLAEGRFQDAINTGSRAVELLRQTGDLWEMNMCRYQVANAFLRSGRLEEATATAAQMYRSGREIGDQQATGISLDVWARSGPDSLPIEVVIEEADRSRPDAQSHAQTQLAYAILLIHRQQIDTAIERLQSAILRCRRAGHLNTYISPLYAWLATAMRLQLESTDVRDGRLFRQRQRHMAKAASAAMRVANKFPADRAHALREQALSHALRGNVWRARRLIQRSISAAKRLEQPQDEFESLGVLRTFHQRYESLLGPLSVESAARFEYLDEVQQSTSEPLVAELSSTDLSVADRFATVLESGKQIAQGLEPESIYREASESARRLLRGNAVDVFKVEHQRENHHFVALNSSDGRQADEHAELFLPLLEEAVSSRQSVSESLQQAQSGRQGSVIAAPITYRGTPIAVILVRHDELANLFGDEELRIADFIASLAGAALENADSFRRLQLLNNTLEQKVEERTQAAEQRAQQLAASNQQLRSTEEELRKAIDRANAANDAKSRFLATISHEIRTPLNGILGMTRLAQQSSVDRRQANYLDTVQESGHSLLTLINDILDVSKLEAGKLELERVPVKLHDLIAENCRLMAASAWQKDVELVCKIDADVPQEITGDPSRLRQIIMNLIGNAIKFTEAGFVSIVAQVDRHNDDQKLMIAVRDSGIGIAEEKQAKIFDSFSQADSSTTRRYGGTGLGLAICRELAELMGGTIELQSEPGVGSQFSLVLPFQTDEPSRRSDRLANCHVAVIDSLPASKEAIAAAFDEASATVHPFDSIPEFSETLSHQSYDMVVFGIEPDSGLCKQILKHDASCLLLVPPLASWEIEGGTGMAEIRKPALAKEILSVAEAMLKGTEVPARYRIAGKSPAPQIVEDERPSQVGDSHHSASTDDADGPLQGIRVLVAEDGEINREVISGILDMLGCDVELAVNGEQVSQVAADREFDICLMDVDMPVMDGIEATIAIRGNEPETARLPIVAMTAHCSGQISERCRSAGMDDFLTKPVEPKSLLEVIRQHVGTPSSETTLSMT